MSGPLNECFCPSYDGKKNLNDKSFLSESADFGHFSPFLARFWPVMDLVSVSKALCENISPHYDWIEFEQQKKIV